MRQVSTGARWGAAVLASVMLLAGASGAHAAFTPEACLAKKLKEWGKLRYCEAKENGKRLQARPADLARCQTKFEAQHQKLTLLATAAAIACRYGDNGDGTVTDYDTGLMWEQKDARNSPPVSWEGNPHDADNLYSWSVTDGRADGTAFTSFLGRLNGSIASPTLTYPIAPCATDDGLVTTGGFAGHCDWRLPSIEELQTIVDMTAPGCGSGQCIDQAIFGPKPTYSSYWSASTRSALASNVWTALHTGGVGYTLKSAQFYVRAVRSAFPELQPVAVAPGNGACLAKKLKEWGKRRYCEAKENGKLLQERSADVAKCKGKLVAKLAAISAQAAGNPCRYGANIDGTVTDYDTGLEWEQKKDICPAGYTASGDYTASFPYIGGSFTLAVNDAGTAWSGTATSGVGNLDCSGAVTGAAFSGTCSGVFVSGSFDCGTLTVTIGVPGGSGSGAANPGDVQDMNARYTWSTADPWTPTGTAFTVFLGTLNNGTSNNGEATSGCFAGQCDWRLPVFEELERILDRTQGNCGGGAGPCIDQIVFGPTVAGFYWSATGISGAPIYRAGGSFADGGPLIIHEAPEGHYVRAVRSGL